jgi:oligoribonuclease NrnB/cAMP/cGMP phosphodiesterase (DHH superfamily)
MRPICFFHRVDLDGVCSAAIVKHFVPDCELYGMEHGYEFPWEKAREGETDWIIVGGEEQHPPIKEKRVVYLVDFNLPIEDMRRLASISNLIWCDHHKTALDACSDLRARGMRDTSRAACELTWAWFSWVNPGEASDHYTYEEMEDGNPSDIRLPEAVRLLGAYDAWRKDDPEWESKILPFQYAVRSEEGIYDPECPRWRFLFGVDGYSQSMDTYIEAPWLDHALERGRAVLAFQKQQNRKVAQDGCFDVCLFPGGVPAGSHEIRGSFLQEFIHLRAFRGICLNTPLFSSQSFEGIYDPEKHDVMVAFALLKDRRWKVSLYSTKATIDCGAIAKAFGGGGHKGAGGFRCDRLPWEAK